MVSSERAFRIQCVTLDQSLILSRLLDLSSAIPSPSAVISQKRKGRQHHPITPGVRKSPDEAPLLQTVPLLYDVLDESPEDAIFNFRRGISPATTPVHILMSSDWRMGVASFQPSDVWREEGRVGTLVLFSAQIV